MTHARTGSHRGSGVRFLAACATALALSAAPTGQVHGQGGIAERYLHDVGIENDPDVVLAESFETGVVSDLAGRWTDTMNLAGMSLEPDVPPASRGARSLLMTSIGGVNTGGYLYKALRPGHDQLYLRYYVKYTSGAFHHTGGWLGGYNPLTDWPQGGAGTRPVGNERFSVAAEPVTDTLRFDFYVYWMHMRGTPGNYWGNRFIQDPALTVPLDRWLCVEYMIKLNNPVTSFNGELALWVDGQPIIHLRQGAPLGQWSGGNFFPTPSGTPFEGFQWRNTDQLNINWLWLQHYATGNPAGVVGRVSFDHVVLARRYVGPINTSVGAPPLAPTGLQVQ